MQLSKKVFLSLLLLEIFVNFSGIATPFFSNDPALYAAISKTMVQRNDFLDLYVYGADWLDKPHFPFWMAAFSFKLFGVSEWSYRLPALLFILLGALYTYLLARKIYNSNIARIAVVVLLSAQHLLMSNTDVRAEPYLLALIIGSVYHFYTLFNRFSLLDLIAGSLFAGCAVMTKGIFALVPIATAIMGHAIFLGQFKQLCRWRWLLAGVLTFLFLFPGVYAVYVQFDQHPEKLVFGKKNVSGIRWFLWDSQFSRFVNNGPITRPKGDIFYYVHTLLWAFAPWCLLFYYVLVKRVISLAKKKPVPETLTISALLPMLLFFSLSKFQLNFYTNILFPFFSILVASLIASVLSRKEKKFYSAAQILYSSVLILAVIAINFLLQPPYQWIYFIVIIILLAAVLMIFRLPVTVNLKWLIISCLSVSLVNFYLNATLYPMMALLKGERQAADFVNKNYPGYSLGVFYNTRNAFEFYSRQRVDRIDMDEWASGKENQRIYYVDENIYNELLSKRISFKVLQQFQDFASESVSGKFINHNTRNGSLHRGFLITR